MPLERLVHILRLGLKSLLVHRLRSGLAILGIVLGVASVIIMFAIGEAARFEAIQQLQDLGATNILVLSVKPLDDTKQSQSSGPLRYGLTRKDLERIRTTIPTITSVTPLREFRQPLRYKDRKLEGRVLGVTPDYFAMNGLRLGRGRLLTPLDDAQFANVAVLGAETAQVLFPVEDPIGRAIRIGEKHYYQVVGITESRAPSAGIGGSLSRQDYNRDVYIPFSTDQFRFGTLLIYYRAGTFQVEKLEISQLTVAVARTDQVKQTAAIIEGLLAQYHTQKDTAIAIPLDLLEKAERAQRIYTLVLGAIASISLLVGGIGIMNIMLATVTERTREIGIRRAMGAKRRDILWQFLVETVVLASAGGLLGVGLGIGTSYGLTRFLGFATILRLWPPLVAFTVSAAVGLIFGIYPAHRAARMDPIEALRHE